MPSVSDGSALTGFSRRKVAVDELFLSEISATGWLGGALNWKNSYSAEGQFELADVMNVEIYTD
jgi:hypothetical protein